ncbi:site-specific DNA-methyltransferase [Methylomonas fluvii]|uniref:site-specific DNA-methyltransferase (adenine-specific) n=1 Tax=Methylomonas fluvii TaxID=1854564 RepID=A0ABR9DCI4_9GAMM|nr:site-specific DNA-methyltransferase [Methylomonas fluvii]MBD9360778.1 site-specific DNA-methyltransferase [Methylomonas fluvii]CAD6873636.1 Type III restriction-modification system methylation subunit (EC 2.1.1.72) [Methylomonas fluvii]
MSNTDKYRSRLINLLKELFQLDQPELDFGFYKIMHAKSVQISRFLEQDLLNVIQDAFGEVDEQRLSEAKAHYEAAIEQAKKFGAPDPEQTDGVKEAKAQYEQAKDGGNAESEIYDHLYRFFERYYDNGDFMSRRYYARESDNRAASYAVPYDGREVYLHWANKDQYYIKSSEYLSNYSFDLNEAIRQQAQIGKIADLEQFASHDEQALKVHFRIVDASEGEHGNIKATADQKRFFLIHAAKPVEIISLPEGEQELVINFEYRTDPDKTGQDAKWQETRLQQAEAAIIQALQELNAAAFLQALQTPAPTDSKDKRSLLGKYLQKYAARNTMDYFIHKDLGGFLRRELDFYIKNEIMRLDDIDNADAPQVQNYLSKIRVLRKIALQLIAFLAQLEEFQKKLWLKKKFVTECHYCITLDRIAAKFYPEIAANDRQREEWIKLFAINEIAGDLATPGYSEPLTVAFLQANPYLLVDTALFSADFEQRLLAEIPDLDAQCNGVLIHSENFQALGLMQAKYREQVKCIYIDPPYNTGGDGFAYKDSYQHSSWLSNIYSRLALAKSLQAVDSSVSVSIDDNEMVNLSLLLSSLYGDACKIADLIWQKRYSPDIRKAISDAHEYILVYATEPSQFKAKRNLLPLGNDQIKQFSNPDNDPRGPWKADNFTAPGFRPNQMYEIETPDGRKLTPPPGRCWMVTQDNCEKLKEDKRLIFGKDGSGRPAVKRFLNEMEGMVPWTWWDHQSSGHSQEGLKEGSDLFSREGAFSTQKPTRLIQKLLHITTSKTAKVFDFFAGSGTTAHATINLNRQDNGSRKYILAEQNDYFDTILKPRIQKVVYSKDWKDGKPVSREGISHCFKTLRLESYEDVLNNLVFREDDARERALDNNPELRRDYLLNYFLDVETQGSQSLLNIAAFRDPFAYQMWIKKPGSESQTLQSVDLVETFNWLIGLWVSHMAAPQGFSADFVRETDPDLPQDQNTRLLCKRLKPDAQGDYWFRLVEGYTLKIPGDDSSRIPTLIVWRKLTTDLEKDNAVLQTYLLDKLQISPREQTYGAIYVNGSHTLPNPVIEGEQIKVRLIEEAFHAAMWSGE